MSLMMHSTNAAIHQVYEHGGQAQVLRGRVSGYREYTACLYRDENGELRRYVAASYVNPEKGEGSTELLPEHVRIDA